MAISCRVWAMRATGCSAPNSTARLYCPADSVHVPKRLTPGDVMRLGIWAVAFAVLSMAGAADAQAQELRGPAEIPPPGYTDRQYVDSAGCVFMRASYGSVVSWVPRVGRDRRQICGYTPSLARAAAPPADPAPAPPSQPLAGNFRSHAAGGPMPTVALNNDPPRIGRAARKVMAAPPKAAPGPRKPAAVARPVAPVTIVSIRNEDGRRTNCPNAPRIAQRFVFSDGRQFLRCGPPVANPVTALNRAGVPGLRVVGPVPAATGQAVLRTAQATPRGYERAFRDDRLNPGRGPRTAAGDAQMRRVWTDDVPQRMHKDAVAAAHAGRAVTGQGLVQVGAFAVPSNAEKTRQALRALNLPVAVSQVAGRGGPIQVIYAGPFASGAEQAAALGAVRRAGYRDAFMR